MGTVTRVNGPLVEVAGLTGVAMSGIVTLGERALPGEVVTLRGESATIQAYEYTGGLAPGTAVRSVGSPLSAPLGPGLLGGVFDGLLRPLAGVGPWLDPAAMRGAADGHRYAFTPVAREGDRLAAGAPIGTVRLDGAVAYQVLVPPGADGEVREVRPAGAYPGDAVVARVGDRELTLTTGWPVRRPRPYRERLAVAAPLRTGQRVIDLLFPVPRGGTVAVPGGFGTGKTMLLQQIAKWCDADVIIYVGCGERGNEMADVLAELAELTDPRTGGRLAQRTVVIANTSNMPMMAREASIYSAVTVAEHFRDMGLDAVVIADSTSRWAEALREFASRSGELPAEEGYPAALASALAAFYERAGRVTTLGGGTGSVTIIGAVSPPGGDLTEPVTTHTQRFVRALWTLDRDLAYARHYPAVSWAGSFARDADAVGRWQANAGGDSRWAARRGRVAALLAEADRLAALAELVGAGALPDDERVVLLAGRLIREAVLQQSAISPRDASCDPPRAAAIADAVLDVVDRCQELVAGGTSAAAIEELDFTPVIRAREDAATPADVRARRDATLSRLRETP
ncbi:MAG TPA: V-type ATP synthase subunit A [Streptosporangiaceae bacterium]|nr:V-type ATP synthase subunit A [Streptosporangiaceae bacterium]